MPDQKTGTFRLKDGKKHNHNGEALKPGQVIELTETQARAFRDKFDPVSLSQEQKQTMVNEINQHGMINPEEVKIQEQMSEEQVSQEGVQDEEEDAATPPVGPVLTSSGTSSTLPNSPYNPARRRK